MQYYSIVQIQSLTVLQKQLQAQSLVVLSLFLFKFSPWVSSSALVGADHQDAKDFQLNISSPNHSPELGTHIPSCPLNI